MKLALTAILAIFSLACSSIPEPLQTTANSSGSEPNGGGLIRNPTGGSGTPPGPCDSEQTENLSVTPNSSRGANVVLALDDSGSMGNEIDHVVSVIDGFIRDLILATQDNLRLILVFSMTGMNGSNGSAFGSGDPNPFLSVIDNQRIFYVDEATGSRGSDIALFKTFSMNDFMQQLPAIIPSDAGNATAASCAGAGKYFRPRANTGLDQTPDACIVSPGRSGQSGSTLTGPLGHLIPDVAVNFITVSDDDNNVAGEFTANPYNGADLVLGMLRKATEPLGSNVPIYYHSIVGTPTWPTGTSGIARYGSKHMAMSARTGGLVEDIRENDYNDVFENLTERIIYSEQVVTMQCEFSESRTPVVTLNGTILSSDKYQYSPASKSLRLLPTAFEGMPSGSLSLRVVY